MEDSKSITYLYINYMYNLIICIVCIINVNLLHIFQRQSELAIKKKSVRLRRNYIIVNTSVILNLVLLLSKILLSTLNIIEIRYSYYLFLKTIGYSENSFLYILTMTKMLRKYNLLI